MLADVTKCFWLETILGVLNFQRVATDNPGTPLLEDTRGVLETTYLFYDDGEGYHLLLSPDVRDTVAYLVYPGDCVMRATIWHENAKGAVLDRLKKAKIQGIEGLKDVGLGYWQKAELLKILKGYFWERVQDTGDDAQNITYEGWSLGMLCGRLGAAGDDIAVPHHPKRGAANPKDVDPKLVDTLFMIRGAIEYYREEG